MPRKSENLISNREQAFNAHLKLLSLIVYFFQTFITDEDQQYVQDLFSQV